MDKLALIQHKQQLNQIAQMEQSVVRAVEQLVKYLDGKTTKTQVVNQLTQIGTPDALKVADAVKAMHETLMSHKNTDLTEVTKLLKQVVVEISKPAKEITIPEQKDTIKVSNLKDIDFTTLEKAVKAIKLDPKIDVKAPDVRVETDLKPLQKSLTEVIAAVKAIIIPETPKTDLTKLEAEATKTNKQLEEANKKLQKIVEKPVGGGGGGGSGTSFKDSTGRLVYVELDGNGNIPVAKAEYAQKITVSGSITYIGKAAPGTAQATAAWQAKKIDESVAGTTVITWANGDALFDNVATDLTALTYS